MTAFEPPTAPPPPDPAIPSPVVEQDGSAAIYEQGYRNYEGERSGVPGAIRSLVFHSMRAVLGLGRSFRHKIMPIAVVLMAFTPAAVFLGVAALLPSEFEGEILPTYAGYYGFITAALFLFASFVAPELLCGDQRTGMLGVYLASPLDRRTYLLGKSIAVFAILALVTIGPPLLLLIGLSLVDAGPDGWIDGLRLAYRIILSGSVMSMFFAAISMAVSATTDRRAAATATIIGVLVGSSVVANVLVEQADQSNNFLLGDLLSLPFELTSRIHGEVGEWSTSTISTGMLWLGAIGTIAICAAWIWDRYRRMLVRR